MSQALIKWEDGVLEYKVISKFKEVTLVNCMIPCMQVTIDPH